MLRGAKFISMKCSCVCLYIRPISSLQSLMNRWKELLVDREGDVVGRLQEAVSEKKDNAIVMRRSEAIIVKENIEMMVSLGLKEQDCHSETWIANKISPRFSWN